ncbi:MAG: septum formation protein Maf [Thermoleophilia bacterium]|nr:septum formation protein Maf [Thermoleophilia bacterium]
MGADRARFLLASGSPQRRAIFAQLDLDFRVEVPDVVELEEGEPIALALANSQLKAAAASELATDDEAIIAVDTIVMINGEAWGKPRDVADAERMLRGLRGQTHTVVGGLTLVLPNGNQHDLVARTDVMFRNFGDDVLAWYLEREEWRDRAGAYAIQHTGASFIERIDGDYLNVVGFPVAAFLDLATDLGLRLH